MYGMALVRNLGLKEHKYTIPMASCRLNLDDKKPK